MDDPNDDADAGLLRATALAEKATGLEAELGDADDDTDADFENATALVENAAGYRQRSMMRRRTRTWAS